MRVRVTCECHVMVPRPALNPGASWKSATCTLTKYSRPSPVVWLRAYLVRVKVRARARARASARARVRLRVRVRARARVSGPGQWSVVSGQWSGVRLSVWVSVPSPHVLLGYVARARAPAAEV